MPALLTLLGTLGATGGADISQGGTCAAINDSYLLTYLQLQNPELVGCTSLCMCVNQSELRQLCRQGFPAQYRADIWKRLIYSKVADVMTDKGDHYYRHLVMRSHDSPVRPHRIIIVILVFTITTISSATAQIARDT